MGKGLAWKWSEPLGRGGRSENRNKLWKFPRLHWGWMCEGDRTSRGGQGMVEIKLLCHMWLSPFLERVYAWPMSDFNEPLICWYDEISVIIVIQL